MGPPSRNILGLVSDTSPSIILTDDLEEDLDDDINEEDIVMIIMIIVIVMIMIMIMIKTKTMTSGRETQLRSPFYSPLNSMWQVTIVFTQI